MEPEDEEEQTKKLTCRMCGHIGLEESDGFYYCQECGAQADDIILTGVADEDFIDKDGGGGGGALYSARFTRRSQSSLRLSAAAPSSQSTWHRFTQQEQEQENNKIKIEKQYDNYNYMDGVVGPTEPEDFGSGAVGKLTYEDYYNEVRIRYVMGVQWMVQLQCDVLVREFKVHRFVRGVAGTLWLRFLVHTGIFKDSWADDVLLDSEAQKPTSGEPKDHTPRAKHSDEFHNAHGQRAVMVWFRYLRKAIPLSSSLAICFLACHVLREAILPTDMVKWSVEGKLPYFAAHVEIEKRLERPSRACPISSSLMFRPSQAVSAQKLEAMSATFADSIGLHLPPVNFYGIALRYLKKLSLPVEKILPNACRIYEWSMPPDLWLSTNELRLPTRVGVMSILIVAIRILYNINGFGAWERSLSSHDGSYSSSHHSGGLESMLNSDMKGDAEKVSGSYVKKSELDTAKLLHNLEARYYEICDNYEFTKDLPSYLQYCKDMVFAGAGPSHLDHREEEELIQKLWEFYENAKDSELVEELGAQNSSDFNQKRSMNDDKCVKNILERKKVRQGCHEGPSADNNTYHADNVSQQRLDNDNFSDNSLGDQNSEHNDEGIAKTPKDKAIRRLKIDMEDNRFCYIPPRVNVKRFDYLHYVRKKDDGALTYVAHADYYILLRACARVAQVDIRIMHIGVLGFEKRLAWLEKRIDQCLHLTPPSITCQFCGDVPDHSKDDPVGISEVNS